MRAPFDRAIDLYDGVGTATPYAVYAAAVPARLVPDVAFVDVFAPLSDSVAYVTMDAIQPVGAEVTMVSDGVYTYDYTKANRLASVSGGGVDYIVLRVESRTWSDGTNYWRAHIAPYAACKDGWCPQYSIDDLAILMPMVAPNSWQTSPWGLSQTSPGHWALTNVALFDSWTNTVLWDGCGSMLFSGSSQGYDLTITCDD